MDRLGLFPLPAPEEFAEVLTDLGADLRRHRFQETSRLPFPGRPRHAFFDVWNVGRYRRGERNAYESSALSKLYYWDFARTNPAAQKLFEIFALTRPVDRATLVGLLSEALVDRMIALQILVEREGGWVSRLTASANGPHVFFHDNDFIFEEDKPHHVFLGRCSMRLADHVAKVAGTRRLRRTLDLCTGSGVQAMTIAGSADKSFGGDINPRAIEFARANARSNGIANAEFRLSDLWKEFDGRYDLITANTPFLLLAKGSKALSGNGGHLGMEVELRILDALDEYLEPGGLSLTVVSSALVGGQDMLLEKLRQSFGRKSYRVDLYPINRYMPTRLYKVYRDNSVDSAILYVLSVEKQLEAPFALKVHEWPPLVKAAYSLQVRKNRLVGWSKAMLSP
jgi:SAM-dependent methyltransferase